MPQFAPVSGILDQNSRTADTAMAEERSNAVSSSALALFRAAPLSIRTQSTLPIRDTMISRIGAILGSGLDDIGTTLDTIVVAIARGQQERACAVAGRGPVDVGIVLDQKPSAADVVVLTRPNERSQAIVGPHLVGLSAMLNQQPRAVDYSLEARHRERSLSIILHHAEVSAVLDQESHAADVAIVRRYDERSRAVARRLVDICPLFRAEAARIPRARFETPEVVKSIPRKWPSSCRI